MKRILLVGLVVAGLAVVGYAIPVFAHGTEGTETSTINKDTWEVMYEACETGDWEVMAEAAVVVHGDNFGSMPYHDENYYAPEEAMTEAMEEVHGDNFGSMPYHDEGNYAPEEGGQVPSDHWGGGGTQHHMSGGMMGW